MTDTDRLAALLADLPTHGASGYEWDCDCAFPVGGPCPSYEERLLTCPQLRIDDAVVSRNDVIARLRAAGVTLAPAPPDALRDMLRRVPGLRAIDLMLTVAHHDDRPCACDECMEYGAEDAGSDWARIPVANRIVMRILDSGDDRMATLVEAFRDHEAAQPEDAAAPTPPDALAPHPGQNHDYRMTCLRCGEPGYLFVGFHSPGETFRWSEAQPKEADRE